MNCERCSEKAMSNSRIARDGKDQSALLQNIGDILNPFDININKEALFNIKTGKKVTEDAECYLLTVISEGEKKQDSFIEKCDYAPEKFEKPIKRCKIVNFASEHFEQKNTSKKARQIVEATPKLRDINEARCSYFELKCKPKHTKSTLDSIKSVEPSLFLPCRQVLLQQIKRAWYIAKLYKNATEEDPAHSITPLDYGWQLSEGKMQIKWYDGEQVPFEIEELIAEDDESDIEYEDDSENDTDDIDED